MSTRIAIICGGPSLERGVSLHSARTIVDHLVDWDVQLDLYFVSQDQSYYHFDSIDLYCNTVEDFEFKLHAHQDRISEKKWFELLKKNDLVFPAIHGHFGEDGQLQKLLERHNIPFVGSHSQCCQQMFFKNKAAQLLKKHGFYVLNSLEIPHNLDENRLIESVKKFYQENPNQAMVVKPVAGGSSLGVFYGNTVEQTVDQIQKNFQLDTYNQSILLEPYCIGKEFTILVLENKNQPVALIPTEIETQKHLYPIFNYRQKYLPSQQTFWHCPPRFSPQTIQNIREKAQEIFTLFQMRDFARLDGWVFPDGTIHFSDLNPISGMDQNSFLFQQAAVCQMTHQLCLGYIINQALYRHHLPPMLKKPKKKGQKKDVFVLFGGKSSEKQVSVMSGTNVYYKLYYSPMYHPLAYFLDPFEQVWQVPYACCLHHNYEEILMSVHNWNAQQAQQKHYIQPILQSLGIESIPIEWVQCFSKQEFLLHAQKKAHFVFLALHGGDGENGVWQNSLQGYCLFNGCDAQVSALCMDKYASGQAINEAQVPLLQSLPKQLIPSSFFQSVDFSLICSFWETVVAQWNVTTMVIKPLDQGCSNGVIQLSSPEQLFIYMQHIHNQAPYIDQKAWPSLTYPLELPTQRPLNLCLEPFIQVDTIDIEQQILQIHPHQHWLELTVGFLCQNDHYYCFEPSMTIAENKILSLEEKFQSGTGINMTPPPKNWISRDDQKQIQKKILQAACLLGIQNYGRMDVFFNTQSKQVIFIEMNTLPALSPSTVLFHQALQAQPSLDPLHFLQILIQLKTNQIQLSDLFENTQSVCDLFPD